MIHVFKKNDKKCIIIGIILYAVHFYSLNIAWKHKYGVTFTFYKFQSIYFKKYLKVEEKKKSIFTFCVQALICLNPAITPNFTNILLSV